MARKSEASARVHRSRERPLGDDDIDLADFERAEPRVLQHAREAVARTIRLYGRGDPLQMVATVVCGLFVDLVTAMPGRRDDVVGAVNDAIEPAGLVLLPRK